MQAKSNFGAKIQEIWKKKFQNLNFRSEFSIWFHLQKVNEITILDQKGKKFIFFEDGTKLKLLQIQL